MRKAIREFILTACILVCSVNIFGCGKTQISDKEENVQIEDSIEAEKSTLPTEKNTLQAENSEEFFYEEAGKQGIGKEEAKGYWEMLLADNILEDEVMMLTGLVIEDMDDNGEKDLLVMTLNREEKAFYGSGCVWIYMNEDEPFCFEEEAASYYGWFDYFVEDIDNDGNVEIVLSTQGDGCGAVGDSYKVIFKYKNHSIETMELPSDFAEDDSDRGIYISVYQEPKKNHYSAYCDYLKENIDFDAENAFEPEKEAISVGANARGFFNLRPVEYKGKNALQASEYLYGEGGVVHNVATAQFIILWDKNGNAYIEKWWIDEYRNCYVNKNGSRITYADGYYYYASQLDNYFLYRVKEGGSEAVCLAKVHPGSIFVDGDVLYFVNLSDNKAVYRIGTDGSDMRKICDNSDNHIQMSAEYIYFLSAYEREADIHGLVPEVEIEEVSRRDDSLYRIRKDGSGKELLLTDADNYMIVDANGGKVMYEGYIYCGRDKWNKENERWETVVTRCGLDGENEEEICRFGFNGDILVYGDRIYCHTIYGDDIRVYTAWKKEMRYLPNIKVTDYCIYNGVLYGIREDKDENGRSTKVYRLENGETQWEEIYCNNADCVVSNGDYSERSLTDIYATEQGIFFRQFVSFEEGVKWFSFGDEENAEKWEDEQEIPITKQASMMEYTYDASSIKVEFKSTDGYEDYLGEDLTYEEFYRKNESGEGFNPYTIRLPQFNEKIEGYQKINAYFREVYQEALGYQEEFFDMLDEEKERLEEDFPSPMLYEGTDYDYVYIGETYITVAKYQYGYWGGIRSWHAEEPVTFEQKTGRVVSLEEFFGTSTEEAVAKATASIYKYMENGNGYSAKFFLQNEDILTREFVPEQFFLFPEGIGLYYQRYAIGSGAEGDYLFIVPYP